MKLSPKTLLFLLFAALVAFCLFGCSAKIKQRAVDEYKASEKFPQDCADNFPTNTDTAFLPGTVDTVTTIDYRYDSGVTVVNMIDTGCIKVVKTITIRKVDTVVVTRERTDKLDALRRQAKAEVENLTKELIKSDLISANQAKENAELKAAKRKWFWLFWGVVGLFAAGVYLRVKKVI